MVVPDVTKEFLESLGREDLPKIKFNAPFLVFVTVLMGEIVSEMDEEEIDVESLSRMLFIMDNWLVGKDHLGTTTIQ